MDVGADHAELGRRSRGNAEPGPTPDGIPPVHRLQVGFRPKRAASGFGWMTSHGLESPRLAGAEPPEEGSADAGHAAEAPRVAVLIPCYNEALTIEKVVKDFARELPRATIHVFDNNSTDGSGDIRVH